MLFPDLRSVVLGFYTEIDEDGDGEASLEEYICIVVVVNVNDQTFTAQRLQTRRFWH